MKEVTFIYVGDLAEGEAYEGELSSIEEVGDWSLVGMTDQRLSILLDVNVTVSVEVQYEDRDTASYDREDDLWFGAEDASTVIEETVDLEVFIEVDRAFGEVVGGRVLTSEVHISGPFVNRRPKRTPYRRPKGTPLSTWFDRGCGLSRSRRRRGRPQPRSTLFRPCS